MILDTFYMLFKSDTSQAAKGVADLEKKIAGLTKLGEYRTDKETKNLKEAQKQYKELNQQLKETENQYTKVAESLVQATTGAITFGSIIKGIFSTGSLNSNLQVQSKLIGQTTTDLKAYGAAAKAAGGSSEDAAGYIQGLFERFSAIGLGSRVPKAGQIFDKIRQQLKLAGSDLGQREGVFQRFNVPQGLKPLLSLSDEEYAKSIALNQKLADNTAAGAEEARKYSESWANVQSSLSGVFTTIGTDLFPAFETVNKELVDFFDYLKDNKGIAELTFTGAAIAVTAFSGALVGTLVPALATLGTVAATALAPLAIITGGVALGKAAYNYSSTHGFNASKGAPATSGSVSRQDQNIAFWMSQGYTREQAAAWAATSMSESGDNPAAVGDGGRARGSFQWHPDRQADILRGLGINVGTASHEDNLRAAAWEAKKRGDDIRIKAAKTPQEAAALITKYFERPADITGESIRRGQAALDIAGGTSLGGNTTNSKSINVKIGDVNVHTNGSNSQAVSGDVGNELRSQIQTALSNLDDGVKY